MKIPIVALTASLLVAEGEALNVEEAAALNSKSQQPKQLAQTKTKSKAKAKSLVKSKAVTETRCAEGEDGCQQEQVKSMAQVKSKSGCRAGEDCDLTAKAKPALAQVNKPRKGALAQIKSAAKSKN